MAHYIKTGFWEKAQKGALGWLHLERLITDTISGQFLPVSTPDTTITDAATMDVASAKETLTSSAATRTFTISYPGDDSTIEVILNTTSATYTFPANSLCVSEGVASGDNTLELSGTSGDHYIIGIKNMGSTYYVVAKNFGQ